ncbi:MAG: hypothetical protein ACI4MN_03210 [Candidatus Coproplasma sp.]
MKKLVSENSFYNDNNELPFSVGDFWGWAYGNMLNNTQRGALAEYLVQRALELDTSGTLVDWGEYDVLYRNKRIEVKSSAYIQAWNLDNDKYSDIKFSIRPAHVWDEKTYKYGDKQDNNNDIYIFSFFEEKDKSSVDICNLSRWGFYVVSTEEIKRLFNGQKTVTLNSLTKVAKAKRYAWSELKSVIDNLINELDGE